MSFFRFFKRCTIFRFYINELYEVISIFFATLITLQGILVRYPFDFLQLLVLSIFAQKLLLKIYLQNGNKIANKINIQNFSNNIFDKYFMSSQKMRAGERYWLNQKMKTETGWMKSGMNKHFVSSFLEQSRN